MAKHISIGNPVNEAERWAFEFLKNKLPDDYKIYTNLEIYTNNGVPREIDAVIFGEFAIYILDVKGYRGNLVANSNFWELNEDPENNYLSNANFISRVFANLIKRNLSYGEHAAWCQGVVFVTGEEGKDISITKDPYNLCIYSPKNIISGLTQKKFCTSFHQKRLTKSQIEKAEFVIGANIWRPEERKTKIGFKKNKELFQIGERKYWEVTRKVGDITNSWILIELDKTKKNIDTDYEKLKNLEYILEKLRGIPGIQEYLPLVEEEDGHVNLVIMSPRGEVLGKFLHKDYDDVKLAKVLVNALNSIEQFISHDVSLINFKSTDLYLSEDCITTFNADKFIFGKNETTSNVLKRLYKEVFDLIKDPEIRKWYENSDDDLDILQVELDRLKSGKEKSITNQQGDTQVLSNKFLLNDCLYETKNSETWIAEHILGQFECEVEIINDAEIRWPHVKNRVVKLMHIHHPNLERLFDLDHLPDEDRYAVSKSYIDGMSLENIKKNDITKVLGWLKQCMLALQYLHRQELYHGNVTPRNIICNDHNSTLKGISLLPDQENDNFFTLRGYGDEKLFEGYLLTDIKGIWDSFLMTLLNKNTGDIIDNITSSRISEVFGNECVSKIKDFYKDPFSFDLENDYLVSFNLMQKEAVSQIPAALMKKWNISPGYMEFVTLDLLNDPRPRSRNQVILNALRSRKISGNKTNKNSFSSTISRLKAVEVIEYFGKKIKLSENFLDEWKTLKI